MRCLRKYLGNRRGQAMTESALVFIPLVMMVFGVIDSSLALWVRSTLDHAARAGVRYGITYQTRSGMGHDDSIKAEVVANSTGLLQPSDVTVAFYAGSNPSTAITSGGNIPGNIVVVTAERDWNWVTRMVFRGGTIHLRSTSADVMEGLGAGQTPPTR